AALSFTPTGLTQVNKGSASKKADDPRKSVERAVKQLGKTNGNQEGSKSSILIPSDNDPDADDPDLPPWMAGKIDKEAYLLLRGDYIDMLRGRPINLPGDPREKAILQLEKQEAQVKERVRSGLASPADLSNWTFLGPAPIPLGQTSTTRVPV